MELCKRLCRWQPPNQVRTQRGQWRVATSAQRGNALHRLQGCKIRLQMLSEREYSDTLHAAGMYHQELTRTQRALAALQGQLRVTKDASKLPAVALAGL